MKLSDLVGTARAQPKAQSSADIDLAMRKWRVVMAASEAQHTHKKKRR